LVAGAANGPAPTALVPAPGRTLGIRPPLAAITSVFRPTPASTAFRPGSARLAASATMSSAKDPM
jgi:hypothetical protein